MTELQNLSTAEDEWLFDHADQPSRRVNHLAPITRYLCGATYISSRFADRVIRELMPDGHRAVVPAIGYDVEPVVRHAYRARRIWLTQHILITLLLAVGLALVPVGATILVLVAFLLFVPSLVARRSDGINWKLVLGVVVALFGLSCLLGPLVAYLQQARGSGGSEQWEAPPSAGEGMSPAAEYGLGAGVLIVVAFMIALSCRATMLRVLATELAAGSDLRPPEVTGVLTAHRLETVRAAQYGNIVLHSDYNPFLGAGIVSNAWSTAIELKPALPDDGFPRPRQAAEGRFRSTVVIDPVDLNRFVKHRLAALRSPDLPERERMEGLILRDQIIATGTRWRNFPLIDDRLRLPYSVASRRAMDEIIRNPQSSARHFLRASIGTESKPITRSDGTLIMPAEHNGVVVTAFSHIAVEGGLLYVETITAVLGPIKRKYLDMDQYVPDESVIGDAFGDAVRSFGPSVLLAPVRLVQTIAERFSASRQRAKADKSSANDAAYDFGATREVREMASSLTPVTYLQRLDASKYAKLLERRINEAVIDYLREKGIDTSEYERRVNVFTNNGVMIAGDNLGAAAGGDNARASASRTESKDTAKEGAK
jgi:hypothetical protein